MKSKNKFWDDHVHKDKIQLITILFELPQVKEIVFALQKKYSIPKNGFKNPQEIESWNKIQLKSGKWETFNQDIQNILNKCKKLRTDNRLLQYIKIFILTGKVKAPTTNFEISHTFNKFGEPTDISVTYHNFPSKQEKKHINSQLKSLMEGIVPEKLIKHKPKKKLKQKLLMLEKVSKLGMELETSDVGFAEKMKYTWRGVAIESGENPDASPKEMVKIIEKIRKQKQRIEKQIEKRIGWDNK